MDVMNPGRRRLSLAAALALACGPALAAAGAPGADGRVPGLNEVGQKKYRDYLSFPRPRAFAISRDGHCGFASGTTPRDASLPSDPKLRALEFCRRFARAECELYAVDDQVVYQAPAAAPTRPPAVAAGPTPVGAPPAPTPTPAPVPAAPAPPAAPLSTTSPSPLAWVLEITAERGFNDLYTLPYTESGSSQVKTWTIQANTGLGLAGGATFLPLADGRLRTRATVGFKFTAQSFANGEVRYYAFPLELIETAELGRVRLGGGLYALVGATVSGTGVASNMQASFDASPGVTLSGEWMFSRRFGVGVRWIWNRLTAGGQTWSAPAIGAVLSFNGDLGT